MTAALESDHLPEREWTTDEDCPDGYDVTQAVGVRMRRPAGGPSSSTPASPFR
ncbi:hypothetical protein ACIBPB_15850 [Micromonospora sp. NPDC049836]|uniref:hypothetical protein n=1 Tax=Micromonospora sp. NPDC049836 TaxID=3364274 RepID=UPI00379A355B